MRIGIPTEIKSNENRVGLPPAGVFELVEAGHEVYVEKGAGIGSAITDEAYEKAGATLVEEPSQVWACDLVIKVKEPLPEEYTYFREGLILFTYLHLAAHLEVTQALLDAKVTAIAYENIQLEDGSLPLLAPMSQIAGRMAVQVGSHLLERHNEGKGVLLAGVPGVKKGKVVIIGGGVSGTNAAIIAHGFGANVAILDVNLQRLNELDQQFNGQIETLVSNQYNLRKQLAEADLVIGAVLIPGSKAPTLVTREMVASMSEGSVIVDIAIDQGGIFETATTSTTHERPTYIKEGVIHYAVSNMPGAVAKTATYALSGATLPYAKRIADQPMKQFAQDYPELYRGVVTYQGHLTHPAVAKDLKLKHTELSTLLTN